MKELIKIKDLSYSYNSQNDSRSIYFRNKEKSSVLNNSFALKGINMHIDRGEIVGIIGPSGAGKSTLLQHLNGLIMPQQGSIYIDGKSVIDEWDQKELKKFVGLLFQNPEDQIFEKFVGDEIAFAPLNFGFSIDDVRKRLKDFLEYFGYEYSFKDRLTYKLSGGEKRIVAFMSIIIYDPRVLVLDEPTASLDSENREKLIKLLEDWVSSDRAVVLVSHDMDEILRLCNRVYILNGGRVVSEGPTENLLFDEALLEDNGLDVPEIVRLYMVLKAAGFEKIKKFKMETDFINWIRELKNHA